MICGVAHICTKGNQLADLASRALTINAALTVEVGRDEVPCQEAVDRNLIDDVEQQEGHTGEAEGLQQTPCVAWRRRRKTRAVSAALTLRICTLLKPNMLTCLQLQVFAGYFLRTETAQPLHQRWMAKISILQSCFSC